MTNTVENTVGCPILNVRLVTGRDNVESFPNPATYELTIKMDIGSYNSFVIADEIGQSLMQQQLSASQTKVNIKVLTPGMYYITLSGDNGTAVRKFVKM